MYESHTNMVNLLHLSSLRYTPVDGATHTRAYAIRAREKRTWQLMGERCRASVRYSKTKSQPWTEVIVTNCVQVGYLIKSFYESETK